ncbi:MAG: sodium-independent anion transporter, partial [Pseudomonadota bacterium]|nr:sodium-independent anion transporter [Pseudomonadota bacterium]
MAFFFRPKLVDSLKAYSREQLGSDIAAGLTVGVVALPLAMAFAIASGLKPEAGLFTAIIAGFIISALGGSKVQIGGPAGAFIVIVYGILERYGLANLIIATAASGVLLFIMGLLKLGTLIRFIPVAVVIGFTNGIAVLIMLSQAKDFLGLRVSNMPADFFGILRALNDALPSFQPTSFALALASLLLIVVWQRTFAARPSAPQAKGLRKTLQVIPGSIVALVAATLVAQSLELPVETIVSKFGGIPSALPSFVWPEFSIPTLKHLGMPIFTLTLLGAIESLLCARIADGLIGDRHNPNQELMAQGVANFVTPFFGGMPATGTIARTVTNVKSGGRSPIAGMVHALTLLVVVWVAAPLANHVPLAALAAILMFVAWNMGEWHAFSNLKQFRAPYRITLVAVFLLTVMVDLTVAVEFGLFAACITFIYRISNLSRVEQLSTSDTQALSGQEGRISAYRFYGALFFGAVKLVEAIEDQLPQKAVILDLKNIIY